MAIPKTKKFNGKEYKLKASYSRKSEANRELYGWRREGHYARIAYIDSKYHVYVRWHVRW